MNKLILSVVLLSFGCGYSQVDNETVAYVKHVTNPTPMLCADRTDAELDLRTPGTMTSERVRFTVLHDADAATLRQANVTGAKVKVMSNERRAAFCTAGDVITKVEILSN